jgi:hypothetical protein
MSRAVSPAMARRSSSRRLRFPVGAVAGLEILDEAGGMPIEMSDIGAIAFAATAALHGNPVQLAVHSGQPLEDEAGLGKRYGEFGARILLGWGRNWPVPPPRELGWIRAWRGIC